MSQEENGGSSLIESRSWIPNQIIRATDGSGFTCAHLSDIPSSNHLGFFFLFTFRYRKKAGKKWGMMEEAESIQCHLCQTRLDFEKMKAQLIYKVY